MQRGYRTDPVWGGEKNKKRQWKIKINIQLIFRIHLYTPSDTNYLERIGMCFVIHTNVYMATGSWPRRFFILLLLLFFKLTHKIDDYPSRMYRSSAHSWILRIKTSFLFHWVIYFFFSSSFIQKKTSFFLLSISMQWLPVFSLYFFANEKCAHFLFLIFLLFMFNFIGK